MILLLALLAVLTLGLVALVIFGLKDSPAEKEAKIKLDKLKPEGSGLPSDRQSQRPVDTLGQQDSEIEKLTAKLRKSKEDCQRLEEELSQAKKNETAALEELRKLKSWLEKESGQDEADKNEMRELKEKLVKKDEEYEKEFSLNLNLKKELNEYKQKAENLQAQNNEYAATMRLQEAKIKAYVEEVKNLTQAAAELKMKDEDSQWVSRKDYDDLKNQLKELEDGRQ